MEMISRLGFGRATTVVLLLLVGGCASAPFDTPRTPSYAEPPSRSGALAEAAAPWFNDPENRDRLRDADSDAALFHAISGLLQQQDAA